MSFLDELDKKLGSIVPLERRNKHFSFVLILASMTLDNLNVTGTLSVYASIKEHFGADTPTTTWVLSAYALTLGAFIMLGGKATDILGPKKVFLTGVIVSSFMSLIVAAIEKQIIALIVIRALQGMAASLTIPSIFPIAFSYYAHGGKLGYAILAMMVVYTGSAGLGLVLGGAFALTSIGYKALYYFSFAIGFVLTAILYFTMYPVETQEENKKVSLKNLDIPGTAMIVVGILLIILGLTEGGESWKRPSAYVPIPVGVLVLLAGAWFELVYIQNYKDKIDRESSESLPIDTKEKAEGNDWRYDLLMLIPRQAFQITNFVQFVLSVFFCCIVYISVLTLAVQYFQVIEGDNPLMAGLKTLPLTVGLFVGVLLNNEKLIYKISMKWVITGSQAANVFMILWMSYHNYHVKNSYWKFYFVPLFFYGFFFNTFFGVYFNAIMRNTPGHLQGVVSGLLQTIAQAGFCLGNALMATLIGVTTIVVSELQKQEYKERFQRCNYVLLGVQAAMVLVMLALKDQKAVENEESE
uniref:MFS transporter n=1 Tax=Cyberlindnera americana TaxID=36016 RepID=A0A5P8N8X3_9ASCO|nr:MFS transporter [Cyberlindnera americana]